VQTGVGGWRVELNKTDAVFSGSGRQSRWNEFASSEGEIREGIGAFQQRAEATERLDLALFKLIRIRSQRITVERRWAIHHRWCSALPDHIEGFIHITLPLRLSSALVAFIPAGETRNPIKRTSQAPAATLAKTTAVHFRQWGMESVEVR